MQMRRFRGKRTVMSFRLCSRAPWTISSSAAAIRRASVPSERLFGKGTRGRPRPGFAGRREPGGDRVVEDILAGAAEVVVGLDDPGREASSEQVAGAPVAPVEVLGVVAVEILDARAQLLLPGEDDQV